MKRWFSYLFLGITCLLFTMAAFLAGTSSAEAKTDSVLSDKKVVIQKNQNVENVVVLGHSAMVDGKVDNAVVVVNGKLHIGRHAKIDNLVLVIGGDVTQDRGAEVTRNMMVFHSGHKRVSYLFGGIIYLSALAVKMALSLILVAVSALVGTLAHNRLERMADMERSFFKVLGIGFISLLIFLVLLFILPIGFIALPVVAVVLALLMIYFIIVCAWLSGKIGGKLISGSQPRFISVLVGAVVLIALLNFPLIGEFVFLGLLFLAFGDLVVSSYFFIKKAPNIIIYE
ncbi:hypothetical protein QS257_15385 [Terrilactibacillus sp. S3-3]|nr:hypothetical protein QS257_15385 [Terrilactibacillus sp. S3-3]